MSAQEKDTIPEAIFHDHIQALAWTGALPSEHVLNRQYSVSEYRAATNSPSNLLGFVFVETDRKSSLSEDGWNHALEEIDFLRRIKAGEPKVGEGHTPEDKSLLLGAVPWAPMPASPPLFDRYLEKINLVNDLSSCKNNLIKGFRYLVQDKPAGTQLNPNFIQNLLTLERQGVKAFDLAVDFHRRGRTQLQESVEMLTTFYASSTTHTLTIVLDHLCKPDLSSNSSIRDPEEPPSNNASTDTDTDSSFTSWRTCIHQLASFPTTTIKLSGLFSEMPQATTSPDEAFPSTSTTALLDRVRPYTRTLFSAFGAARIMFGSDWPVCNANAPGGPARAWRAWVELVHAILDDAACSPEERESVWAGTARRVYGLDGDGDGNGDGLVV